jgi:hypothetical protein
MAITPLPDPPSRSDPTNFPERADAFMAALPGFATEANALAQQVDEATETAGEYKDSAESSATAANGSATNALLSETHAQGSAVAAAQARADAEAARDLAKDWASKDGGTVGGTPFLSARQYAALAAQGAGLPIYAANAIPATDLGPICVPGVGEMEWDGTKYAPRRDLDVAAGRYPNFGYRNLLTNGEFVFDQANSGVETNAPLGGLYVADQWQSSTTSANVFSAKVNDSTLPPVPGENFRGNLVLRVKAPTPVTSGMVYQVKQNVEGCFGAVLGWGTPGAVPAVLSFWVYSNFAGTFGACVSGGSNLANVHSYPFLYTVHQAATWERKVVVIPPDNLAGANTYFTTNAGAYLQVRFNLGSGDDTKGPPGVWANANWQDAQGAQNVLVATGLLAFRGMQLERLTWSTDELATPFEYQRFDLMNQLVWRYFELSNLWVIGSSPSASALEGGVATWKAAKRINPTVNFVSTLESNNFTPNAFSASVTNVRLNGTTPAAGAFYHSTVIQGAARL